MTAWLIKRKTMPQQSKIKKPKKASKKYEEVFTFPELTDDFKETVKKVLATPPPQKKSA